MSNNLRTRNGMPFNFVNGLKVRGMDIESLIPGIEGIPEAGSKYQFAGNGSNKVFTLPVSPYNKDAVDVYVKQLYVHPDDYTLVGDVVTLTEAPPALDAGETYNVLIKVNLTTLNGYVNASRVSYEGENLDVVLAKSKPLANYSNLRAYAGAATQVRITDPGIAGFFYYDALDTTSADNGGTVIVSSNGKRWKRVFNLAELVKYTPAGAGAVTTTVQEVLRETISVKDFGAVGDGVTDDTIAIKNAIAAAKAAGGGDIKMPKRYRVSSKLVIPSNVALIGAARQDLDSGYDANILYTGSDACIEINNTTDSSFQHNTRLENLTIRYTGASAGVVGIRQSMSSVVFSNVRVYDFSSHGLDIGICIFSTYYNIRVGNCGGAGVFCYSSNPVYPGGQAVFVNPQIYKCQYGFHIENHQTVQVIGGTVYSNTNQQIRVLGSGNIVFQGVFTEPQLGNDRTYYDKLIEVAGTTISGTPLISANVDFIGCNIYAGQSGTAPRYNYGVYIGNSRNVTVKHCTLTDFQAAAVKIVFDTNVVTQYEVGPNRYSNNVSDFDRAGSSSTGVDSTTTTQTITNQNLTFSGTSKLTVQGTYTAPMAFGSFNAWFDTDSKLLRKSGTPSSATDGTSAGFGSVQTTVGAAGGASALPATPSGYAKVRIGGSEYVIPYYAVT